MVIARAVDIGQTVAASLSAPKLFQIAGDLTRMQVETKIDEADIGRVVPGLPATFTVDAFPDDTFEGTVRQVRLEPLTEQNVVTYTTVIDVANPELKLKPGMTANVTIRIQKKDDVLRVPNAALRFRPPEGSGREGAGGAGGAGGGRMAAASPGAGAGPGAGSGTGSGERRMRGQRGGRGGAPDSAAAAGGGMRGGARKARAAAHPRASSARWSTSSAPAASWSRCASARGSPTARTPRSARASWPRAALVVTGVQPKKGQAANSGVIPPGMGGGPRGGPMRRF